MDGSSDGASALAPHVLSQLGRQQETERAALETHKPVKARRSAMAGLADGSAPRTSSHRAQHQAHVTGREIAKNKILAHTSIEPEVAEMTGSIAEVAQPSVRKPDEHHHGESLDVEPRTSESNLRRKASHKSLTCRKLAHTFTGSVVDELQRQQEDGSTRHQYMESEDQPLQQVQVLSRDKPDGHHLRQADQEGLHHMQVELSSGELGHGQQQELPDGFPELQAPELTQAKDGLPLQLASNHRQISAIEGSGVGCDEGGRTQIVKGKGMTENEIMPTYSNMMFPTMGIMKSNRSTTEAVVGSNKTHK